MGNNNVLYRLFLCVMLVAGMSNCAPDKQWQLQDVSGHLPDLQFNLIDDAGSPVTARNYRGDVVLLYFGFTGCGTQCPIIMERLSGIVQRLGKKADHVHVLLVTVDPAHDTSQALHKYVRNFDKNHIVGLTGTDNDIENIARRYRTAYRPHSLVHGNAIYIFDASGKARLLASGDSPDESLVHDLRQLVQS